VGLHPPRQSCSSFSSSLRREQRKQESSRLQERVRPVPFARRLLAHPRILPAWLCMKATLLFACLDPEITFFPHSLALSPSLSLSLSLSLLSPSLMFSPVFFSFCLLLGNELPAGPPRHAWTWQSQSQGASQGAVPTGHGTHHHHNAVFLQPAGWCLVWSHAFQATAGLMHTDTAQVVFRG